MSCSDGGGSAGGGGLGIDDGASQGQSISRVVLPGREATLMLGTGARVQLPAGALKEELRITLTRPPDASARVLTRTMMATFQLASAPYVLAPHRTRFAQDVTITLPVARGDASRLVVARLDDEQDRAWELIGAPAVAAGRATIKVDGFSVLALFERPASDVPRDAGMDGGGLLADASTEAGPPGPGGGDAGPPTDWVEQVRAKLTACNLVTQPGELNLVPHFNLSAPTGTCRRDCLLTAVTCPQIQADFCGLGFDSREFDACYAGCLGYQPTVGCMDASGLAITATACDAEVECADQRDEVGCPASAFFTCPRDGQRISAEGRCDGYDACADGADEAGCPAGTSFSCGDGSRIPGHYVCDADADCADGSDERSCQGQQFVCGGDGETLRSSDVCSLYLECSDGSDEPARCLKIRCPT